MHIQKEFKVQSKEGKMISVRTKPYTLEIERVVKEMMGDVTANGETLSFELTEEQIKKYIPMLLENGLDVNYDNVPYDVLHEVAAFFLFYKKSAGMRYLEQERSAIATVIDSIQGLALTHQNG